MKTIKIFLFCISFLFLCDLIAGENTVSNIEIAPGLLTDNTVYFPEYNLTEVSKELWGKTKRPHDKNNRRKGRKGRNRRKPPGGLSSSTFWPTSTTTKFTSSSSQENRGRAEREMFVVFNYLQLEEEMAIGEGERLQALAFLHGCPSSAHEKFGNMTQKKYGNIFQNREKLTSVVFVDRIENAIKKDEILSQVCK